MLRIVVVFLVYGLNSLCLGLPYVRLRPLDGVLVATARLIGGVPKFGHFGEFMLDTLHWLPVRQRIFFRVSTIAWRCSCISFGAFCPIIVLPGSKITSLSEVVTISYHVLTCPLNRIGPSRRLVPLSGMAFLSNCALFHVIFRARFIVFLRPS